MSIKGAPVSDVGLVTAGLPLPGLWLRAVSPAEGPARVTRWNVFENILAPPALPSSWPGSPASQPPHLRYVVLPPPEGAPAPQDGSGRACGEATGVGHHSGGGAVKASGVGCHSQGASGLRCVVPPRDETLVHRTKEGPWVGASGHRRSWSLRRQRQRGAAGGAWLGRGGGRAGPPGSLRRPRDLQSARPRRPRRGARGSRPCGRGGAAPCGRARSGCPAPAGAAGSRAAPGPRRPGRR